MWDVHHGMPKLSPRGKGWGRRESGQAQQWQQDSADLGHKDRPRPVDRGAMNANQSGFPTAGLSPGAGLCQSVLGVGGFSDPILWCWLRTEPLQTHPAAGGQVGSLNRIGQGALPYFWIFWGQPMAWYGVCWRNKWEAVRRLGLCSWISLSSSLSLFFFSKMSFPQCFSQLLAQW